jgi:phosphoribosylformylglycinamidine (FGAM) synthase PurS component
VSDRIIAIRLKIPDNSAYTAMVTLRRLGIDVQRVERADILRFENEDDLNDLRVRIERDESIFNPNKHRITMLTAPKPRPGEVWIEAIEGAEATFARMPAQRYVGWRLFTADAPAPRHTLAAAVEALLCNPAIERAIY